MLYKTVNGHRNIVYLGGRRGRDRRSVFVGGRQPGVGQTLFLDGRESEKQQRSVKYSGKKKFPGEPRKKKNSLEVIKSLTYKTGFIYSVNFVTSFCNKKFFK